MEILKNLKKGQEIDVQNFELKEAETSPPSRYNSGSIILAMEKLYCHTANNFRNIVSFVNKNGIRKENIQGIYKDREYVYLLYFEDCSDTENI